MGTVKDVLLTAKKELGTKETPPNSNNVKYNDWYYNRKVSGVGYPWCMVFCQWVYDQCGVPLPTRTASCTAMLEAAKKARCFVRSNYQPGDLILFDFKGKPNTPQHCGILISSNGVVYNTIEGNTGTTNDADGGMVMLRQRRYSQIAGAVRPKFQNGREELDMTIDEFIAELTPKQASQIVDKARSHMGSQAEPSWSKTEKHWDRATGKKIVDGKRPEDLIKRDEVIAILGRSGIL